MVWVPYSLVTYGLLSSESWGLLFPAMVTRTTQFGWTEFVWPHRLLSFDGLIEFVTLWSHRLLSPYGLSLLLFGHTNSSVLME